MPSVWPAAYDNFPTDRNDDTPNPGVQAVDHNNFAAAIGSLQQTLGLNPQGDAASVDARLDALMAALGINAKAEKLGQAALTIDPVYAITNHQATTGVLHGVGVVLEKGRQITKISCFIQTAGAALTHGQLGIYDKAWNLVAVTADSPASFQATGWVELDVVAGTWTVPATDIYYPSDVYTGTTMPYYKATGQTVGPNHSLLPGGMFSYWQVPGPFNTLPASLAGLVVASSVAHMMAVR